MNLIIGIAVGLVVFIVALYFLLLRRKKDGAPGNSGELSFGQTPLADLLRLKVVVSEGWAVSPEMEGKIKNANSYLYDFLRLNGILRHARTAWSLDPSGFEFTQDKIIIFDDIESESVFFMNGGDQRVFGCTHGASLAKPTEEYASINEWIIEMVG